MQTDPLDLSMKTLSSSFKVSHPLGHHQQLSSDTPEDIDGDNELTIVCDDDDVRQAKMLDLEVDVGNSIGRTKSVQQPPPPANQPTVQVDKADKKIFFSCRHCKKHFRSEKQLAAHRRLLDKKNSWKEGIGKVGKEVATKKSKSRKV